MLLLLYSQFKPMKSEIRIGRSNDCEVVIRDKSLSRYHSRIYYEKDIGWLIHDGSVNTEKKMEYIPSKNGTWLFVQSEMVVTNGMMFKNSEFLFECEIKDIDDI